jgi:hypothetical protein
MCIFIKITIFNRVFVKIILFFKYLFFLLENFWPNVVEKKITPYVDKCLNLDGDGNPLYEHHNGGPDRRAYQVIRGSVRPVTTLARFDFDPDDNKSLTKHRRNSPHATYLLLRSKLQQ